MKQPYELWVLADEARDPHPIESCVQAAGHRVAGLAHSVTELRVCIAEHRAALATRGRGLMLLIDTAMIDDADTAEALVELLRSSGLPAVQLASEPPPGRRIDDWQARTHGGVAGHVTCALTPRELALAVELASARQALARAEAERARYQDEIRQLNRVIARRAVELQAMSDELEALAYSVSHDLRAPLRTIEGFGKLTLERLDGQLDPRIHGHLRHICDASQRMSRLIDDLCGLSRLMRREMHIQTCDLSAMARDALALLQQSDPGRSVEIEVAPGIAARADAGLLHVVLQNLLDNAWKFTSRTPAARIEVGVTARDGQPAYFVRDNGVGFHMANAGKLFGPFQRLHSDQEFEGTGIGLATAQRIVRRHGGDIWAEAAADRGATFTFTLSGAAATTA